MDMCVKYVWWSLTGLSLCSGTTLQSLHVTPNSARGPSSRKHSIHGHNVPGLLGGVSGSGKLHPYSEEGDSAMVRSRHY